MNPASPMRYTSGGAGGAWFAASSSIAEASAAGGALARPRPRPRGNQSLPVQTNSRPESGCLRAFFTGSGTIFTSSQRGQAPSGSSLKDALSTIPQPWLADLPESSVVEIHEPLAYRLKNKLLGPPLHTERLEHERLGKPTALAVFASDNLSSSAYATEEILRVLLPMVGVAAFALVMPITVALLVVLGFLILSYRQTIKAYPTAGGAYIVTRDNFGLLPAQVAGVALLTDYILTVAVSVAAGQRRALIGVPRTGPYKLWIVDRVHRAHRLRQSARREGVGQDLRRPHLLLHRQHGDCSWLGRLPDVSSAPADGPDQRTSGWCTLGTHDGGRLLSARRSSSCSRRSHRAGPP